MHIPTEVICLMKLLQIKVLPKKILKGSLDRFDLEREAFEETVSDLRDKLEKSKVEICEQFSENNYKTKENVELEKELVKAKDFGESLKIEIDTFFLVLCHCLYLDFFCVTQVNWFHVIAIKL